VKEDESLVNKKMKGGKKKKQGGGGGCKTSPSSTPTPAKNASCPPAPSPSSSLTSSTSLPPPPPPHCLAHSPVTRSVSKTIQGEHGEKNQLDNTTREESKGGNFRWEQYTKELAIKEGNASIYAFKRCKKMFVIMYVCVLLPL
jgi:hypothetical protein